MGSDEAMNQRFQPIVRSAGLIALWAVPFALFFGTLYGAGWSSYGWAYLVSLVFATVIRVSVGLAGRFAVPLLRRRTGADGRYPWMLDAAVYMAVSVTASYVAALIVDRFIVRGFLGSPRSWASSARGWRSSTSASATGCAWRRSWSRGWTTCPCRDCCSSR